MLLVGQKGVGKTSLIKRLIEDKFDFDEPKTEGIDIRRWDVSVNNQKFRLNIWDFGGQEIMHATHQFFLTKRSLYLLILNARQDERDNRIEYWLKLIKSFGGDSPIIIVVNKCDLEMPDVSHKRLQDKYPAIKAIVNTSCKTRQGLQELSELIIEEVGQLKHIYEELPINWFAVKSHLEEIRADYISYQQYKELCQSHGISDERNQATLINFLHDLGVVLNFREDLRLQDTNILNPKWVTNGVYYILNNNLLFQAKGVLDQEMLAQILDHPEYPLDKQLFIMNMMRKFELCFDFEFQDKRFLIPDLLPQEELYTGDWVPTDCLGFQYHYDILPGNIMSRFIVRSNQLIHQNTYWRNGVLLSRNQNKALVKADREDCKTYIQINGPAGTRREFLAIIRAEFDHIHRTISKLEVKEKVPLTDHPNIVVDYQHLITLEQIGETSFIPEGMNERVTIKQLLDGIIPERKRQKQQKGHIAQEKVEPPQKVPVPISSSKAEVVKELTKIKNRLDLNAEKYTRRLLWLYFGLLAITWIGLGILTYQFGWNNMEPWTYFIGGIPTLGSYIYFAIIQRELSPQAIYNQIIETKKRKLLLAAELNGQKWPE
jgi:internalin A